MINRQILNEYKFIIKQMMGDINYVKDHHGTRSHEVLIDSMREKIFSIAKTTYIYIRWENNEPGLGEDREFLLRIMFEYGDKVMSNEDKAYLLSEPIANGMPLMSLFPEKTSEIMEQLSMHSIRKAIMLQIKSRL